MSAPIVFIDGDQGTTGLQIHQGLLGRTDLRLATLPAHERKDPARRAEAINSHRNTIPLGRCLLHFRFEAALRYRDPVPAGRRRARGGRLRAQSGGARDRCQLGASQRPGLGLRLPRDDGRAGGADRRRAARDQSRLLSDRRDRPAAALDRAGPAAGRLPGRNPCRVGYSGGGRAAVDAYEAEDGEAPALRVYGLGLAHKHPPEIRLHAGLAHRPLFVPAYGAYRQGIVLTVPLALRLLPAGVDGARLHAALARHYEGARHARVLPLAAARELGQLDPEALNGSNDIEFGVFVNDEHGHVLLSAVFDNLGKGASGAAVQNLDLMLAARR